MINNTVIFETIVDQLRVKESVGLFSVTEETRLQVVNSTVSAAVKATVTNAEKKEEKKQRERE